MNTTTSRLQNVSGRETRAWFQAPAAAKPAARDASARAQLEVAQDDRDDLSMRFVRGQRQPYEMPGLGWRYG